MSVYWDILSKVKDDLETIPDHPPVEIRSAVTHLGPADIVDRIIIVPTGDRIVENAFDGWLQMEYGVLVGIMVPGNRNFSINVEKVLNLREVIRRLLNVPILELASGVKTCEVTVNTNPGYPGKDVVDGGNPASAIEFSWLVPEERN